VSQPAGEPFCTYKPLGLRAMVDCRGMTCALCGKPITDETYQPGGGTAPA